MKKRAISILCLLLIILLALPLSSCQKEAEDDGRIKIVCTLFPQYDWLKNVVGDSDNIELSLIIANGSDPHSYQPTAADILTISNCDMIVFLGGDSDTWVQEALDRAKNDKIKKIALTELDGVTLHNVSASSGGHSHEHEHNHGAFDEHIWLSLKNAIAITEHLSSALCELDVQNAAKYTENAKAYTDKLIALDKAYSDAVDVNGERFMLFADRFPFVYLLEDYGIEYQAAFEGCTADVDAGFDTVLELIREAELHNAKYVTVTESSDGALATMVISSAKHAKMELLVMNSMQGVGRSDINNGITYLSVMENNLAVLKKAIGGEN